MIVSVRRIEAVDWALVRALRLRALDDAPAAFARTLDEERAMPDARWQERAQANQEGLSSAGFLALRDGTACGLAIGVWCASETPHVDLNALWVAPEARRTGAARALIGAVAAWARERGAARIALEVTLTSLAARALYSALGFVEIPGVRACGERAAPALRMQKAL
jgi:GNAT superfamily N-acetyltransferase